MQRNFQYLNQQNFDVLICGGGIYGAWTAYDAALRGLKVAIVDKGDWAGATSSASSKLIHGGLRYLETFSFKLVKKSLDERQMLLQVAPHRVWPLRFGVPVYEHSRVGSFRLKAGLALYDFLSGNISPAQKHQYHAKADFIGHFPYLNTSGLKCGFSYFDAQTDDARFVLELIEGACAAGAVCVNYCELVELVEQNGLITGAVLLDKIDNQKAHIAITNVVDTSGRWSSHLQNQVGYQLTKGIHLIMPKTVNDEALLLTAQSDGRVFFIIPWYGMTLLGTTDTHYQGDMDEVTIDAIDKQYLLTEANQVLNTQWTDQDIIGQFSGLRVLQQSNDDSPSNISRDWILKKSPNGLLSSIGGKLTSAREDAAQIVDALCGQLGKQIPCSTFGKPFPWLSGTDYQSLLASSILKAQAFGIDKETADWLVRRHGNKVDEIFRLCESNRILAQRIRPELPFIMADLVFCAEHEMVVHLDDLLRRRLPLLILAKLSEQEIVHLANITTKTLGWDDEKIRDEINTCLHISYLP
ncbi:MAG: glycerol-3-phosphate dehydrogenase/oxidase [Methyloglobulus sp.]|nr:glycerol-3-phosphate dehydrogenase/oxidase [Methyloglobulus sp.]